MLSVELFAGCGGLALGTAEAGFQHELVLERDRDSIRTLTNNKERGVRHVSHWNILQADCRDIKYDQLGDVSLLSGGPPCQPFSIGGKHLGPADARNMWPEALRAIREMRPKAFILENVRGLFRPDFSSYLEYIMLQLSAPEIAPREDEAWTDHLVRLRDELQGKRYKRASYRVVSRSINAADYGAPQKRHRAIFIGALSEFGDDWSFPEPTHSQEALAWAKHVDLSYWQRHDRRRIVAPSSHSELSALNRVRDRDSAPETLPWVTVRDAIGNLPRPGVREVLPGHWQHPGARAYKNHTGSCYDEPAKALKAGDHGVPGGENMLAGPKGAVRYFTVREMARLQGFPDEFIVDGSWKAATRQLGNAVPTMVGKLMGQTVMEIISRRAKAAA